MGLVCQISGKETSLWKANLDFNGAYQFLVSVNKKECCVLKSHQYVFVQIYVLNLIQLKVYNLSKNFLFCPIFKTMHEIRDLRETIESGPLCITDLFQNKSVAYF